MAPPEPTPIAPSILPRVLAGVLLVLLGAAGLIGLVVISNSQSESAQRLLFRLGLAYSALISAVAQAALYYGLWLLWKATRRDSARSR